MHPLREEELIMRPRDYLYYAAKGWGERIAAAMPGVRATASIGDYRLSIWHDGDKLRFKTWYVTEEKI